MKFLLLIILIFSFSFAKVEIVTSIIPQRVFVEKIGGNLVDVESIVEIGESPHTYEPKPSKMLSISKADIYFRIGVEFEEIWLEKFKSQNRDLKVINLSTKESKVDPHIWLSPTKVQRMAQEIFKSLAEFDSKNRAIYRENLENFLSEIKSLKSQIRETLKDVKGSSFLAFHPSWGYFAKEFDLIQLSIERDGKEPKPKELIQTLNLAKSKQIRVILTKPEVSDKSAKVIAKELNVKIFKISPLNPNWGENLLNLAKAIAARN